MSEKSEKEKMKNKGGHCAPKIERKFKKKLEKKKN